MKFNTRIKFSIVYSIVALVFSPGQSRAAEISFENDSSLPVVTLNVAFKAGAVTDPPRKSGLTNFMGEMLLRGTKEHSKKQIEMALDQMGAQLQFETRAESVILRGSVLSTQLKPYLDLLKEIITEPAFPSQELIKLKAELIAGIQEELGHDSALASRAFTSYLFQDHPYGNPILGKIRDLKGVTRSDVLDHYHRVIREPLLLVVGSGDSSEEEMRQWATQLGKDLTTPSPRATTFSESAPIQAPKRSDHRRLLIVDKPDRTQTQINLGQIGIQLTDPDYFKLYLANHAVGGPSFSSILMQEIRVKRGWSYGANSGFRFGLQPRSWTVHLFPAAKDTPAALAYTLKIMEDLKINGITEDQFSFARRSLINNSGFTYNTPAKRVENTLLEKTLNLPKGFMKTHAQQLAQLKLGEVNEAIKKFVRPESLSITVVGTAKELKTALSKAAQIDEGKIEVRPYDQE